jgi:hypothetical protein
VRVGLALMSSRFGPRTLTPPADHTIKPSNHDTAYSSPRSFRVMVKWSKGEGGSGQVRGGSTRSASPAPIRQPLKSHTPLASSGQGLSENEIGCARISMMAGSTNAPCEGRIQMRPTPSFVHIRPATHGRSLQLGRFQTSAPLKLMSAFPSSTDFAHRQHHFRKVPTTDIRAGLGLAHFT